MFTCKAEGFSCCEVNLCAECAVSFEDLVCNIACGCKFACCTVYAAVACCDHYCFILEVKIEVLLCKCGSICAFCEQCVVDDLCNYFSLKCFGICNTFDTVCETEVYSRFNISPRIYEVVVSECAYCHCESVFVLDACFRCKSVAAYTYYDALTVYVRDCAVVLLSCCTCEVNKCGSVFRTVFPLVVCYPTGADTANEESHLITLNVVINTKLVALTVHNVVVYEELNCIVILRCCLVFAFFYYFCCGFVFCCCNIFRCCCCFFCKDEACAGNDHQEGKNQRKNLFHLNLCSLKN